MIIDTFDRISSLSPLVDKAVFDRIQSFLASSIHPPFGAMESLIGTDLMVRVLRLETKLREDCRYETHREYTDLQWITGGGEFIDWTPRDGLTPAGPHDSENDVRFYGTHPPSAILEMRAGMFAVFRGPDAHRPQIKLPGCPVVEKFVFKVHNSKLLPSGG